jgi:hypothetical protein
MLDDFVVTPTMTEKLQNIFFEKCKTFYLTDRRRDNWTEWADYLNKLEDVEYIYQFSHLASTIDYLIETINERIDKQIVIKDMGAREFFNANHDNFILMSPEFAMKVLSLGYLP